MSLDIEQLLDSWSLLVDGCIAAKREDRTIVHFSAGCEAMFGYTQAEAMGMPVSNLLPVDKRAQHDVDMAKFGDGLVTERRMGGSTAKSLAGIDKGGQPVPVAINIVQTMELYIALLHRPGNTLSLTMQGQLDLLSLDTRVDRLEALMVLGGGGASSAPDWEDATGGNTLYKFTIPTKTLDTLTLTLASRTNDAAFETVTFTKLELENGRDGWDAWVEGKWHVVQKAGWNLGNQNEAWPNWQIWSRVNRNGTVIQVHEQNSGDDNEYGKVYDIAARYA